MSGVEVHSGSGSIEACGLRGNSGSLAMLAAMRRIAGEEVRRPSDGPVPPRSRRRPKRPAPRFAPALEAVEQKLKQSRP
jgi:hypothetical protein